MARTAVWTGATSALVGAAVGVAVALVGWLPGAGVAGRPTSAIRAGIIGFLAAHHAGLTLDGVPVTFAPLLGTAVVAVIAWRAGGLIAEAADQRAEPGGRVLLSGLALQAATYALACGLLAVVVTLGTTRVAAVPVTVAAFLLFGAVSGSALACSSRYARWWRVRLGETVLAGMRAGGAVLAVLTAAGALLVAAALLVHADRVERLSGLVGDGLSGVTVTILGLLATPNAAVAGAAYLVGPGFAVGTGTVVSPGSTAYGTLPAFPLLGAVPDGHGATPMVGAWLVITLAAVGFVAARTVLGRPWGEAVRALLVAAVLSGVGFAVLCWLAGGAAGTSRLRTVGASPWKAGGMLAAEVAVLGAALLGVVAGWRWLGRLVVPSADDGSPDAEELASVGEAAGDSTAR